MTASSTASIVARNTGSRTSPGTNDSWQRLASGSSKNVARGAGKDAALAVEKARKISPELSPDGVPARPIPIEMRFATRLSWFGRRGRSVAITVMIEPCSRDHRVSFVRCLPTGTPSTVNHGRTP